MVKDSSILEEDYIFLVQTKNESLKQHLIDSIKEDVNIRLESIASSESLKNQLPKGKIITFVVGSDVQDPIQSAQRFHAQKENARIILLAKPDSIKSLKKAVQYSPFIGMDVFCLDESRKEELEDKLYEIVQNSRQAEHYGSIIAASNAEYNAQAAQQKPAVDQNFINKLMDIAPIGIAIIGQQGNILGWNKKAAAIFRQSEAQVLGTSFTRLFDLQAGNKLENYLQKSFNQTTAESGDTLTLERKPDKTSRQILSINAAPFTYFRKTAQAYILVIKDVTQSTELLEQLKTEVTARDNFLSMASHELRTPLTTLRINLELLRTAIKQNASEPSDFLRLNEKSLKQTKHLNSLIEDLFDIAKIHSGKLDFRLEKFNLSEFIKRYIAETEEKFKEANCELELDIEPNVVGAWDRDRLEQAFANIISNTLKYAPNAPVKITLKTSGNQVRLSVKDQGPGISADKQERIFERFERATDSMTISGLGLGLFIAKKIVEGHSGKIEISSSPGSGSTFTLVLPLNLDPNQQREGFGVNW